MRKKNSLRINSRRPAEISNILEGTLGAYRLKEKIEQYSGFPRWKELVGDEISKNATPLKIIRGKILVIRVPNATWAQELTMIKHELISRLLESDFGAQIEDLQFVVGDPKSFPDGKF